MSFRLQFILYGAVVLVVVLAILVVTGVLAPFKPAPVKGSLVVWDVSSRNNLLQSFFSSYQAQFSGVRINYIVKNPDTYAHDLLDALASGAGPDIFVLDTAALSGYRNKIAALPATSPAASEFMSKAPDVVLSDLTDALNIYGMPISVDTLALYYNKDYLNNANIAEPPKTWDEFQDDSRRLTRLSPTGVIQRSGATLGLAANVTHALDIFSALLLQSGNPIYTPKDKTLHLLDTVIVGGSSQSPGVSALKFYTNFANPNSPYYTWNSSRPESRSTFAAGNAAFYIGYARDLPQILAENPHLNFGVAPLPQLAIGNRTSYASYEFFTVSKASASPDIAWSVVSSLFQSAVAKPIIDGLGLPPAHRDLIASAPPNKILQPFYDQVLSARSWRIPDITVTTKIFGAMMEGVVSGRVSANEALSQAQTKLQLVIQNSAE